MPFESAPDHSRTGPRYLWVTWIDPAPEHDGQRMYTGRLIDAVARAGARIDVLCLASANSTLRRPDPADPVAWRVVGEATQPGWKSTLSALPNSTYRCATSGMRHTFERLVTCEHWDAIVLDGLSSGWAARSAALHEAQRTDGTKIVYVAHNHEETTRGQIAHSYRGNPLMRTALYRDWMKTRRLERQIVDCADLITAITPEDLARFTATAGAKRVAVMSPGYAGPRIASRTITPDMPRVAVIVGSFEWIAKRMNLEAFLGIADPLFAAHDTRLKVIGTTPAELAEKVRRRARATDMLGNVPSVAPHLTDARIAIVPEMTGGGFKLKLLDYVFHRLPILATAGSTAGAPLREGREVLTFGDLEGLAHGVVDSMDDLALLNRLQNDAYAACADRFDWQSRGDRFVAEAAAA